MNRNQLACYCLMASAFVLGALLLYSLPGRMETPAEAGVVIARENFTMLTARTRKDEEALFVLDNSSQKLLIYAMNIGRRKMEPVGFFDLASPQIFGGGGAGGGAKPR